MLASVSNCPERGVQPGVIDLLMYSTLELRILPSMPNT